MIQAIRKKLSDYRLRIAWLVGASPLILAFFLMSHIMTSSTSHNVVRVEYLFQHQEDIFQSLIVSSAMVAIFCTTLRNKVVIFVAGFQPAAIQAAFISTDSARNIFESIPITALIVLPLAILAFTLGREIGQADDQDKED